jgi:hypothetical protein
MIADGFMLGVTPTIEGQCMALCAVAAPRPATLAPPERARLVSGTRRV